MVLPVDEAAWIAGRGRTEAHEHERSPPRPSITRRYGE
jgi:hypothetical protein